MYLDGETFTSGSPGINGTPLIIEATKAESPKISDLAPDEYPERWGDDIFQRSALKTLERHILPAYRTVQRHTDIASYSVGKQTEALIQDWQSHHDKKILTGIWGLWLLTKIQGNGKANDFAAGATTTWGLEQTNNIFVSAGAATLVKVGLARASAGAVSVAAENSPSAVLGSRENFATYSDLREAQHPFIDYNTEREKENRRSLPLAKRIGHSALVHLTRGLVGVYRASTWPIVGARRNHTKKERANTNNAISASSMIYTTPALLGAAWFMSEKYETESADILDLTVNNPAMWTLAILGSTISWAGFGKRALDRFKTKRQQKQIAKQDQSFEGNLTTHHTV